MNDKNIQTIEVIRRKKRMTEEGIAALLQTFSEETGLVISDIELGRLDLERSGGEPITKYNVELEVIL